MEASTQVGAVKRLIQRVSTMTIGENNLVLDGGIRKAKRRATRGIHDFGESNR